MDRRDSVRCEARSYVNRASIPGVYPGGVSEGFEGMAMMDG